MLEWIKTHPLYDVLIAGGLFIIFFLIARGGSSAGSGAGSVSYVQSGPSDAVQTAQLAASAQQTQAQAALTASAQQTQASLSLGEAALTEKAIEANLGAGVANNQSAAQIAIANAQVSGQVAMTNAQVAGQVSVANVGAQVQDDIAQAQFAAQTQINHDQVAGQVAIAGYSSATTIETNKQNNETQQAITAAQLQGFLHQVDAGVLENDSNNAAAVATAKIGADATTALAGINAGVQTAGINASRDVNLANINAQQTVSLAGINAGVTVAGYQRDLYSQALTNQAAVDANDFQESQYQTNVWQQYSNQLIQLKGLGKDISGLPGTGNTPQLVSAGQPSTASQILNGIANIFGAAGRGVSAGLTAAK